MVGQLDDKLLVEPVRRVEAFRRLADGPATRSELMETLDVSRATLHRVVTNFVDAGLVIESDDGVTLTPVGEEVADAVTDYADRVAMAERVAPLLNTLDPEALPRDPSAELFEGADVFLPTPSNPQGPVEQVTDAVEAADTLRATAPVVLPTYVDALQKRVLEGMDCRLVLDAAALQVVVERYGDALDAALDTGRLDIRVADEVPMGLLLTDESVMVVAYDDEGVLQGAVEGDSERLRSWTTACYEHLWEAGDPLAGREP